MRNIYNEDAKRIEKLPNKEFHRIGQYGCWTKTQYLKLFWGKNYKRDKKSNRRKRFEK